MFDILSLVITGISIVVSVGCAYLTILYQKKAREYKDEVYVRLNDLDLANFSSKLCVLADEINRCSNKENNNRGGRLKSIFDRLTTGLSEVPNFSTNLEDSERNKILEQKDAINRFLINHRDDPSVDITELSRLLNHMEAGVKMFVHKKLQEHKY